MRLIALTGDTCTNLRELWSRHRRGRASFSAASATSAPLSRRWIYSSVPLFPLRGAPAAIGEFMMMERALVAIGVGGIVDDGVTGSIMPLQDLKAIATAALALFAIRRAVERRGAKAVDRALAHFLFDQRAVAHATAYEQALRVRAARLDNSRP